MADQLSSEIVAAMLDPGFYPYRPERVELRETHISWVFLAGKLAYKVKEPLVLPFLDYGRLERRLEMCREEVRLNHRLAPAYYLGVDSSSAARTTCTSWRMSSRGRSSTRSGCAGSRRSARSPAWRCAMR